MSLLEQIPPLEIGARLRLAREALNIKQAEAAEAIKVARTTIAAIEKGERRARINELQLLARFYKTSVNALLRQESLHVDLAPRFRKMIAAEDTAADEAAGLLADLAKAEVELENLLGIKRTRNYPPERPILPGDVVAQAENDAMELRLRLGLGIVTLLEFVPPRVQRPFGRL
jgi:transcriptional regulator with XRE-family HTH domain